MGERFLIIDSETSGLDPQLHSILSLAAIVWEDGTSVAELNCYIREPQIVVDSESMRVNNLDLCFVQEQGLNPEVAVQRLLAFLATHFPVRPIILAGHNVQFDVSFLKRLFRLANADYGATFSHRVLDTGSVSQFLRIAAGLPLKTPSSSEAFELFHIVVPDSARHTAIGDARATAQLLTELIHWTRTTCGVPP